ncbi:MAG: hypothetical protein VYA34_04300 [Myxococcota bacterium]|nr:hypothetical protein [Myxococcota bacterium]
MRSILRKNLVVTLVVGFSVALVFKPSAALAQEKDVREEGEKGAEEKPELGQDFSSIVAVQLAVAEMQRYYEVLRITADLGTRTRLVDNMRNILESRVIPLQKQSSELEQTPITCSPRNNSGSSGCFPREVALAYLYFGLGRAAQGIAAEIEPYRRCAEKVFPSASEEPIYLTRPPNFEDSFGSNISGVLEERYPFHLVVEKEKSRWARGIRSVHFDIVPTPELLPAELKLRAVDAEKGAVAQDDDIYAMPQGKTSYVHPILGLDNLVIEPVTVKDSTASYFAKIATEDLRRVISRVYLYDWEKLGRDDSPICPDPRKIHLPDGRYVMFMKGTKGYYQYFTVDADKNDFLFEYYYVGDFKSGKMKPHVAWYNRAGLCGEKDCE